MNRILLLLLYVFLLSAPALGQEGGVCPARRCDSLHTFRFVQGRDVLYADYRGNDHELKRLLRQSPLSVPPSWMERCAST
ncbi:hypothetical protein R3O83_05335 [Bacteroides hominis (ex Liu et al. 2022)]|nr:MULTISPECIES: hypothetical protein [Bacteroides]MCX8464828.1 hypothetical protein [Bacteroides fragilis]MCY2671845.1 hypothetical protein [Bacteroides fragilis]MCY6292951.1 hypothetical protein [Bacteroides fragilis]MCY6328005.1 hypothetical protein [Bacteroides fragilis]MCY6346498.1 hypothetical protein [Bacteroides fragilis]